MKGILACGGFGTRLGLLTKGTNKHSIGVNTQYGYVPMVVHGIKKFVEAGITEIMIVIGPEHPDSIIKIVGDGSEYGANVCFKIQSQPGGIAQALGLCETFVGKEICCVILGDNIFEADLKPHVDFFNLIYETDPNPPHHPWRANGDDIIRPKGLILLKQVEHPERFGVAVFDKNNELRNIVEKPPQLISGLISNYAVTGIYFYSPKVFDVIRECVPSQRGELEITDVNNEFIKRGWMKCKMLDGYWSDAGELSSYANVNNYFYEKENKK